MCKVRDIKFRKAQAATEYLITYSWAFVIILAAIGTLTYFDAFNPSKYIPDSCDFGEQLVCVDYFVGTNSTGLPGDIILRFRNNFEQDIRILYIYGDNINDENYDQTPIIIETGDITKITLQSDNNLYFGNREEFKISIIFNRYEEGLPINATPEHTLTGKVAAKVADNSLGLV
ncbi:MAG: hypothetical protein AB7V77_04285 [Candidatus Woesearchaeota archaeon]